MHVLDRFRYCPVCGSAEFEPGTVKSKRCRHCGFEYFLNPSAANAALIMNSRDELLVITRKNDPAKSTLDLPGGFYDLGETAAQGLAREVKEETGLTVVSSRLLFSYSNTYLYSGFTVHTLDFFFLCRVKDFTALSAHDDAASYEWVAVRNLCPERFGLDSIRRAVVRFQQDFEAGKLSF